MKWIAAIFLVPLFMVFDIILLVSVIGMIAAMTEEVYPTSIWFVEKLMDSQ